MDDKLSDIQLVKEVKDNNDSKALEELIHRHTGIYYEIVHRYSFMPELEKQELINDKMYNIYQYILDYKEDKNTKLSTYIGHRVKYECMNLITNKIEKEELSDNLIDLSSTEFDREFLDLLLKEAKSIEDKRFYKIIEMRFLSKNPSLLREIGVELGITKECVRQIFEKNMKILRKRLNKEVIEQI